MGTRNDPPPVKSNYSFVLLWTTIRQRFAGISSGCRLNPMEICAGSKSGSDAGRLWFPIQKMKSVENVPSCQSSSRTWTPGELDGLRRCAWITRFFLRIFIKGVSLASSQTVSFQLSLARRGGDWTELTIYSRTVLILGRVKNEFYIYHHKQVVQRYINSLRAASLVDAQFQANSTVIVHSSITTIPIHFTNQRFVTNTAFPRNDFKNSTSGSISPSSPSSSHVIRHQTNRSRVIQRNPNEEHTQRKTHREDKTWPHPRQKITRSHAGYVVRGVSSRCVCIEHTYVRRRGGKSNPLDSWDARNAARCQVDSSNPGTCSKGWEG